MKVIKSLNKKKWAISSCILVKFLIDSVDTYLPIFTDIIISSIRNSTFPEELKLTEVTRLFKKANPFDKVNFRLVSLFSHVSKMGELFSIKSVHTLNRTLNRLQKTTVNNNLSLWKDIFACVPQGSI